MGLSSSQARLLLLTARKSDIEFRGQQINNRRLSIMNQMEQIAKDYSDGIANRRLYINLGKDYNLQRVTIAGLLELGFKVKDETGAIVNDIDPDMLEIGLRNGKYSLENSRKETVDWRSNSYIDDKLYEGDDEMVTAEYEYLSTLVQNQDKKLEMELKQLDTQSKAVETEIDAVKKVIEKNIERSFKTFA